MRIASSLFMIGLLAALWARPALAADTESDQADPATEASAPARLGPLTEAQVLTRLLDLLRQAGDLSAYVISIDGSGVPTLDLAPLTVFSCQQNGLPARCTGGPPKTTFGVAIDDNGLRRVLETLQILNASLANGTLPTFQIKKQ